MVGCVRRETWLGPFRASSEGLGNEEVDAALGDPAGLRSLLLGIVFLGKTDYLERQVVPQNIVL